MTKTGLTLGIAMGSIATFALLQKNKFNKFVKKMKGNMQ